MPRVGLCTSRLELIPVTESTQVLAAAARAGIEIFDVPTALSESRIASSRIFDEFSKIEIWAHAPINGQDQRHDKIKFAEWVLECARASLLKLGMSRFEVYTFNAESVDFLRSPAFEWAAQAVLDHGLCTSVGVCVNHPEEAMAAMDVEWVTALQIPVSLVDVRLIDPELLVVYEMKKIRLIARPGFFLEDGSSADSVTEGFWHSLGLFAKRAGMTAHEMSARFIFGNLGKTLDVALLEADHVEPLSNQLRLIAGDKSPLTPELLSGLRPLQDLALKSGRSH